MPRICPAMDRETIGTHPNSRVQEAPVTRSFVVNAAGRRSGWIKLIIRCSGCAALAGQPWCRSGSRLPVLGRCRLAGGDVLHRWRLCVRDLVQGIRTSSSKPPSTRVDSVGARPRALSIWDALLGPSRRGEIIGSREPERRIWMGQDQRDLDIPVLLEVRALS